MRFLFLYVCLLSVIGFAAQEPPHQTAGKYDVMLRLPPDGLYAQEEMQIEFRVVDRSRVDPLLGAAPVVRARIHATVDMPAMPSMPKYEEIAHTEGIPGEYGVHPTFSHGGEYRLQLAIQPPADEAFQVTFPLQVLDADDARKRKPGPRPFQLELKSNPKNPKAGQPVELELVVRAREKPREIFSSFEVMHEKLMHLLILRSDLAHFAHEHPERQGDGSFQLQYTFPAAGEYHIFADAAPAGAGEQVMMAKIRVGGESDRKFDITKASAGERSRVKTCDGVTVELKAPETYLPAKKTEDIFFALKDAATGEALTDLEPYLGAMGHLMLVHQDSVTFVHSHPDERDPLAGRDGTVPFLVRFPKAGIYRGWSQFKRKGRIITADFILEVRDAAEPGAAQ